MAIQKGGRWGKHLHVTGIRAMRAFSYFNEATDAPDSHPSCRGRHGVAFNSIGLKTAPMLY
jgi:hypothetical protein